MGRVPCFIASPFSARSIMLQIGLIALLFVFLAMSNKYYYKKSVKLTQLEKRNDSKVHSLSSGKGEMFLCATCHAFTPHVNPWKN